MKKVVGLAIITFGFTMYLNAQLKPGDTAVGFKLQNTDGKYLSLSDYSKEKGVVLMFTCNRCPFANAYESRIIRFHNTFASGGYPVVAINPNDIRISPDDTMEQMKERANEKNYPFPYLKDNKQVYKAYGVTRTPQFFLLKNIGNGSFEVAYIGAFDNNAMDAKAVSERYILQAIQAIENGNAVKPSETKAIGCTIKSKD